MRSIFSAIEMCTPVQIIYQSMTSDDSSERIICPHALVRASRRLYVRAWDDKRRRFADFVVLRIKASAIVEGTSWIPAELDDEWNRVVDVVLVPNPELSPPQALTVAAEYKMEDGRLVIRTRVSLAIYLIVELGLIDVVRSGRSTKGKLVVPENGEYLKGLIFGND
jgi:predicted DNA-binding transcriptional regulator YafY